MAGEFESITAAIKTIYPPKAVEAMTNEDAPFRKALNKQVPAGAMPTEGIVKFGGNLNPPQNQGQLLDGGSLPVPKDRDDVQFQLTPTLYAGGFQIGMITRSAGSSGKSAFNKGELARRTEETLSNLGKFIEQTYTGTHGTGRRARVEASTSSTANFTAALPEGTALLKEKQYISIRTTDGGSTVDSSVDLRSITAINHDTRLVTFSGATASLTAGSHVHPVVEAAQSITSVNPFANGLRGLVDDATFLTTVEGLSRSTYPKLKSIVNSNGGVLRNLTEAILIRVLHETYTRSGKRPTDCWTGPGQFEKYIEFVAPDRRYMVPEQGIDVLKTGYKALVHVTPSGPINLNLSVDIVPRELYLLNWSTFFHYVAKEMDWWDGDMLKPTPTSGGFKASYMAHLVSIENIGCDMPLANAVVRDLRDPRAGD